MFNFIINKRYFLIFIVLSFLHGCGTIASFQYGAPADRAGLFNGVAWDLGILQDPDAALDIKILAGGDLPLSAGADALIFIPSAITRYSRDAAGRSRLNDY